ncbi:MAG: hypothetical protein ACOC9D_00805 [Thermodesulfobacteriota bacterium]
MLIRDIQLTQTENRARVQATVVWEDCDQPQRQLFIETSREFAADLTANPQAFLVGSLIPALHFGERRISLDGPLCPGLLEGLQSVMALMRVWSLGVCRPLTIEPRWIEEAPQTRATGRAGMFYSGGFDSLAALRLNRLHYPGSHPGAIRDCFFVHGFDIGGVPARGMKYHVFERALEAMQEVMQAAGTKAIPVYTNLRHLCDDRELWLNRFFGAVLAAVGHAFTSRLDLFYLASSYDYENLAPCGSHPLLDPEYSSFDLQIRHRDAGLSRLDKLRIVADWDPGFQNFRVCLANTEDRLNCGRCEKCVRTMTGLAALGVLDKTRAFVEDDVTPEMFAGFKINIRHREPFYRELLPLLRKRGRMDLVKTIQEKLS